MAVAHLKLCAIFVIRFSNLLSRPLSNLFLQYDFKIADGSLTKKKNLTNT